MNRDQLNRTEMGNTVSAYLAKNKTIWSGVKAMSDTVSEVDANNAAIADKIRRQQTPITGAADEKEQVRLDFEEKILEIADQLSALAEKNKDANLAAQVELTLSSLDKLADDDLEETGQRVKDLAAANLAALADYNVLPADVTALDGLKTRFHGVKSAPRTAIAGRAGETNTLPDLLSQQTSLLRNRLDKLMTNFKKSHPEFFRRIPQRPCDRGSRRQRRRFATYPDSTARAFQVVARTDSSRSNLQCGWVAAPVTFVVTA